MILGSHCFTNLHNILTVGGFQAPNISIQRKSLLSAVQPSSHCRCFKFSCIVWRLCFIHSLLCPTFSSFQIINTLCSLHPHIYILGYHLISWAFTTSLAIFFPFILTCCLLIFPKAYPSLCLLASVFSLCFGLYQAGNFLSLFVGLLGLTYS